MIYQSNATVTIGEIDEMLYQGEPGAERGPHEGVFTGCTGEIPDNLSYLKNTVTVRDIETALMDQYLYRDISFNTWQEFQHSLKITWNRNFNILVQNLENAQQFTIIDDKQTTIENTQEQFNSEAKNDSTAQYTDTPDQFLNDGTFNGLTNVSIGSGTVTNGSKTGRDRVVTVDKGGNAFERWLELSAKNRNIIYNFIDEFAWLFKSTYVISKKIPRRFL